MDAQVICEVHSMDYMLLPLGLPGYDGPTLEFRKLPVLYFVSSPNMDYVPNFSQVGQNVYLRKDGRFYTHDFTLWPQWYFEATSHFPFVRRRPCEDELDTHDLRMIWYDMTDADFVREPGSVANVGRLQPDLVKVFLDMRIALSKKIDDLIPRLGGHPDDFRNFHYAQQGMLITSIVLEVGPQTKLMTLFTLTGFQRFYLESLAFYDFHTKWNDVLSSASQKRPADTSIVGAVMCHLHVAQMFCMAGVPVWLFRAPYQIASGIKIARVVTTMNDFDGLVKDIFPNTACIMRSPPSPIRNRASQVMRIASVSIGPLAYEVQPGDPLPVSCKLQVIIILLCNLALFCSILAALSNATPGPATPGSSTRPVPVQGKQPSLVKSAKVHRQVNLEKFKEIRTDILEDASLCWVNALASVDTRTSNLVDHQDSELLRGYGLPDPLIFINVFKSDAVRFSKFLYVWLAIRAGWIAHITSQRQLQGGSGDVSRQFAQMPLPQHWKDYLIKVGRSVGVTFSAATTAA